MKQIRKQRKKNRGSLLVEKMYSNQYFDVRSEAGYSGARNLLRINKKNNREENKREKKRIYEFLNVQDAYSLHKPVKHKFNRLHYIPSNIDDTWEIDLAVLQNLQYYNDGYCYIMAVIDILSKFVWVEVLKDKKMTTIAQAFEKILKRSNGRQPLLLRADSGGEFIGSALQKLLNKYDIKFSTTKNNDVKAAVVERFLRSLKERMWRYFTHKNSKRYIDIIQDLVYSYNHTKHSTIKMIPNDVNLYNASQARENMISKFKNLKVEKIATFKEGDHVRISRTKGTYEKGYEANWSEEIFKVWKVLRRQHLFIYKLIDLDNEIIDGIFYKEELNLVGKERLSQNQEFLVKEVIKSRGRGVNKEVYVSWVGYPKKFNSWIKASDVNKL